MIYEPQTKTYFVTITPNPTHKGEYVPLTLEDDQLIRKVNHGMGIIKERHIDQIHDLLGSYGLCIHYPPCAEFPSGEKVYLYPNKD